MDNKSRTLRKADGTWNGSRKADQTFAFRAVEAKRDRAQAKTQDKAATAARKAREAEARANGTAEPTLVDRALSAVSTPQRREDAKVAAAGAGAVFTSGAAVSQLVSGGVQNALTFMVMTLALAYMAVRSVRKRAAIAGAVVVVGFGAASGADNASARPVAAPVASVQAADEDQPAGWDGETVTPIVVDDSSMPAGWDGETVTPAPADDGSMPAGWDGETVTPVEPEDKVKPGPMRARPDVTVKRTRHGFQQVVSCEDTGQRSAGAFVKGTKTTCIRDAAEDGAPATITSRTVKTRKEAKGLRLQRDARGRLEFRRKRSQ